MRWCWSGHAEVTFTEEAVNLILREATALYYQFKSPSVPLVSIDMKWKLARLSSALAYLTFSTGPKFDAVTVTREHVEMVVAFLREEYVDAGLSTLSKREEFEALEPEEAVDVLSEVAISTKLDVDRVVSILTWLPVVGGATRDQIKEKFNLSENNELRPLLATLRNEKLVGDNRGFTPSSKLIELFKLLEGPQGKEIIGKAKTLHAQHFNYTVNPGQQTIDTDDGALNNLSSESREESSIATAEKLLVGTLQQLQDDTGEAIKIDDLRSHMARMHSWEHRYTDRILSIAQRDGLVFSPRSSCWRTSQ